jgi:hypothetical protein
MLIEPASNVSTGDPVLLPIILNLSRVPPSVTVPPHKFVVIPPVLSKTPEFT